jgi:hypothetical protein
MFYEALSRMRFLLRRRGSEELDEELQFHPEQSVQTNIAEGMTAEEARRQAMIAFGGVERAREASRGARVPPCESADSGHSGGVNILRDRDLRKISNLHQSLDTASSP